MNKGGKFDVATKLSNDNLDTVAAVIADVDNDTYLDIVFSNDKDQIQVMKNNRNGTFVGVDPGPDVLDGSEVTSLAPLDVNNDGNIDILVAVIGGSNMVLYGDGNGGFGVADILPGGDYSATASIACADMNVDNHVDILLGNIGHSNQR